MPRKSSYTAPLYVERNGHLVLPRCPHSVFHADAANGTASAEAPNPSCSVCMSTDPSGIARFLAPPKADSKLPRPPEPELEDDGITEGPVVDGEVSEGAYAEPEEDEAYEIVD